MKLFNFLKRPISPTFPPASAVLAVAQKNGFVFANETVPYAFGRGCALGGLLLYHGLLAGREIVSTAEALTALSDRGYNMDDLTSMFSGYDVAIIGGPPYKQSEASDYGAELAALALQEAAA